MLEKVTDVFDRDPRHSSSWFLTQIRGEMKHLQHCVRYRLRIDLDQILNTPDNG